VRAGSEKRRETRERIGARDRDDRHFNARKSLDSRTVFRFHAKPQTKHFLYSP